MRPCPHTASRLPDGVGPRLRDVLPEPLVPLHDQGRGPGHLCRLLLREAEAVQSHDLREQALLVEGARVPLPHQYGEGPRSVEDDHRQSRQEDLEPLLTDVPGAGQCLDEVVVTRRQVAHDLTNLLRSDTVPVRAMRDQDNGAKEGHWHSHAQSGGGGGGDAVPR